MAIRDVVDALVAAGVELDDVARGMVECGDFGGALVSAIAAVDRQQWILSADLMRDTRAGFESVRFRPGSTVRSRVNESLRRSEQRAANAA